LGIITIFSRTRLNKITNRKINHQQTTIINQQLTIVVFRMDKILMGSKKISTKSSLNQSGKVSLILKLLVS